jgi:predicted RNase H-like HicB family nuclease
MHNEFTAIIERDDDWFIAYCPEIPGANGQGRTKDEAKSSLADAVQLILEDRRLSGALILPPGFAGRWGFHPSPDRWDA